MSLKESYPSDFGYGRPDFNYPFPDFYPPVYDDPFSWNKPEPSTPDEIRFAYRNALSRNNGYELLRLSKVENEKQLLPDVKAGDILYNAYQTAKSNRDISTMLKIADYEGNFDIMTISASQIRSEAYNIRPDW